MEYLCLSMAHIALSCTAIHISSVFTIFRFKSELKCDSPMRPPQSSRSLTKSRHFYFNNFFVLMLAHKSKFLCESAQKIPCKARDMLGILWRDFSLLGIGKRREQKIVLKWRLELSRAWNTFNSCVRSFFTIQKFRAFGKEYQLKPFRVFAFLVFNLNFVVRYTHCTREKSLLGLYGGWVKWM